MEKIQEQIDVPEAETEAEAEAETEEKYVPLSDFQAVQDKLTQIEAVLTALSETKTKAETKKDTSEFLTREDAEKLFFTSAIREDIAKNLDRTLPEWRNLPTAVIKELVLAKQNATTPGPSSQGNPPARSGDIDSVMRLVKNTLQANKKGGK